MMQEQTIPLDELLSRQFERPVDEALMALYPTLQPFLVTAEEEDEQLDDEYRPDSEDEDSEGDSECEDEQDDEEMEREQEEMKKEEYDVDEEVKRLHEDSSVPLNELLADIVQDLVHRE